MNPTLEKLFELLKQNKGLTLSKTLIPYTGSGYAVAFPNSGTVIKEVDCDLGTFRNLLESYRHKIRETETIGLWIDQDKVYFDVSEVVQDIGQALDLGKNRSQMAIFSFDSLESIFIN